MQQKPPISIADHVEALREAYPLGQLASASATALRWFCNVRPTPITDNYFIQFDYTLDNTPRVRVVAPDLVAPAGKTLPHVFPDGCICIYDCRQGKHEWEPWMPFSELVPWTALWLYYYEIWVVTGLWHGKEARH